MKTQCHWGNRHVFDVPLFILGHDGCVLSVYAGGIKAGARPTTDFVLDVGARLPITAEPAIYPVPWPNFGVPRPAGTLWDAWYGLRHYAALKDRNCTVLVCDIYGHGRAGTALAAIAVWARLLPDGSDPVAWVREHYCAGAVETQSQIDFVKQQCGSRYTVKSKPRK